MAAMCDEMAVIYEDGADNGLESVVERLAEERDRIQSELNQRLAHIFTQCKNANLKTSNEHTFFDLHS